MAAANAAMKTIAASDVAVAARSLVAEPQHQQRHDHAAPADAEQAAEQPRQRADRHQLQRAVRDRSTGLQQARLRANWSATMRAILDLVSPAATLVEALEPLRSDPDRGAILLDIDGTLAPIVRHAADAHVPEATRTLLIEIAKRYGVVGCVSGRRAATARQIVAIGTIAYVGNHGGELLRPGATAPGGRPRARRLDGARARVRRRARSPPSTSGCACAARTRTRSPPSTGAARPTSRPPQRRSRRSPQLAEQEGFAVHWGRKVLEVRPPVALDKGLGIAALLRGGAGDRGALRGRRHDRPRRLPRAARAGRSRATLAVRAVRRGRLRRSAARAGARGRPDASTAPAGVRELLEALL